MAVWLAAAAAAARGLGVYSSGRQQEAQYTAQARANDYNAAILRQRAESTLEAYGSREDSKRRENRTALGRAAAQAAESGTGLSGSNLDVIEQNTRLQELDALNIRYEGAMQAHGLQAQANLENWQGDVNRSYRNQQRSLTWLNTAGSILGSASSAYGNFGGSK